MTIQWSFSIKTTADVQLKWSIQSGGPPKGGGLSVVKGVGTRKIWSLLRGGLSREGSLHRGTTV